MEEIALLDERFEVLRTLGQRKLVVRDRESDDSTPFILRTFEPDEDPFDVELRREVQQAVAVQHPALARIRAIDTLTDGREYYTQDFVEGQGLYRWALRRPPHEILQVFAQLLHILGPVRRPKGQTPGQVATQGRNGGHFLGSLWLIRDLIEALFVYEVLYLIQSEVQLPEKQDLL